MPDQQQCYQTACGYLHFTNLPLLTQYHKSYLERCKYHSDDEGVGKAYEALARAHER